MKKNGVHLQMDAGLKKAPDRRQDRLGLCVLTRERELLTGPTLTTGPITGRGRHIPQGTLPDGNEISRLRRCY